MLMIAVPRWLLCLVCLALPRLAAQTPAPYNPGPVLRIDLEGLHKIVNRASPTPSYIPGPVARIDLEGFHKIINRTPPVEPYAAGPILRLDLEGLHRIRKLP